MIKISTTQIDSYWKYVNGYLTEDQIMDTLLRRGTSNLKMELGSLFHSLIELQDAECPAIFNQEQINHARSFFKDGMHEVKTRQVFASCIGNIAITGVADYLVGTKVVEAKTTWGSFSIDRYLDSLQWQIYCRLFDASEIEYVVFEFPSLSTKFKTIQDINSELQYKNIYKFTMHNTAIDKEKIDSIINNLCKFIRAKGIESEMQLDSNEIILETF